MSTTTPRLGGAILGLLPVLSLSADAAIAQNCSLPDFPTGAITTTQDRDHMLCLLGITLPTLPPRIQDANAPPNAFPRVPTNPEGNWTDPRGHTVVRTAWGQWHTYDSDAGLAGGAMAPFGDYGPFSSPRYTDIELLKMKDGTPVQTPEDWWIKRRPEILKDVQDNLYGHVPDRSLWPAIAWTVGTPTTGTLVVGGVSYQYSQKVITGTIDTSSYPEVRNAPRIVATCRTPLEKVGTKVPVFVVFGGTNAWQYAAPYGYGVCGFSQGLLQPDSGGANLSSYIIGLINKGNWRKPDDWGALAAWSWGVGRLIDYFETDPDIDATKVGLEGHSRFGKATLVTAAFDDRIVAAFPSCGGALGTSWARRAYGETLEFVASSTSEYHWVNGNIMNYGGELNSGTFWPRKVENLPVDVHSVMSLIAPRVVLTNGGTDTPPGNGDAWQDPRGMYLAGAVSSPVWNHLGWPGQIIPEGTVFTSGPDESVGGTPPFNAGFIDGNVGWRRHSQGHTDVPDWPTFVLQASRYFNDSRPVVDAAQSFTLGAGPVNVVGTVRAADADGEPLGNWQVKGGSGAYTFAIDRSAGVITIANASALDFVSTASYTLTLTVDDGKLPSKDEVVTIDVPVKINVCHKDRKTLSISRIDVPDHLGHGDAIGVCAQ
jgi:hypothetical protein